MKVPRDINHFLASYDGDGDDEDNLSATDNLAFYSNELRCRPDGLLIDELHEQWRGDYDTLEDRHGYIQWLFPIREAGMNYAAQPLQLHEIAAMRDDDAVRDRVLRSYELMLDFYGMSLVDRASGLLGRSDNCLERYEHLAASFHNLLRITRILKCLSELGFEHLNTGFVLHVLNEQSEHGLLLTRHLRDSMDRWWANCIRDPIQRQSVRDFIDSVRTDEKSFGREQYTSHLRGSEAAEDDRPEENAEVEIPESTEPAS